MRLRSGRVSGADDDEDGDNSKTESTCLATRLFSGKMRSTPGTGVVGLKSLGNPTWSWSVGSRLADQIRVPTQNNTLGFGELLKQPSLQTQKKSCQRRDPPRQPVPAAGLIMPHPQCRSSIPAAAFQSIPHGQCSRPRSSCLLVILPVSPTLFVSAGGPKNNPTHKKSYGQ